MDLKNKVIQSLKWKESNLKCATKLNISVTKYIKLKEEIFRERRLSKIANNVIPNDYISTLEDKVVKYEENLENNTAKIEGITSTEPLSPEDIIRVLKIDTKKWKLSSYWNKQHKTHWTVSAMVTRKTLETQDLLKETLKSFVPSFVPVTEQFLNKKFDSQVAGVLSIQDLHFGKEGNDNIEEEFKKTITDLVLKAYHSHNIEKIYYVIGGDLLNMDTFSGTTTSGTPVDNGLKAEEAYTKAFSILHWSVLFISQFCKNLEVVYLPGNHDRLSSFHLAHGLKIACSNQPNIEFNVEYSERKVCVYYNNFFAFEHGDVSSKNTPLLYATEFPMEWGSTKFRTCFTGHWHRKKSVEFISENEIHGFTIKNLPSLSATDYWHYHNKFTGSKRAAVLELHSQHNGKVSEFTFNV